MPIVENFPHIDPTVKHVGVSKLRGLNAEKLRKTNDTFVIQENDTPLAVLLTYDKFLAMQDQIKAVMATIDLLSDAGDMAALTAGLQDFGAGRCQPLEAVTKPRQDVTKEK